jgi:hypothetical protein
MASFDRGFENALELRPGETVRWSGPAMHRVRRTWFGGRIYLSDQRFFFCPGVLVRRRQGVLRIPLSEIADIDVLSRKFSMASVSTGGLRPRLRITTAEGEEHSFAMQAFRRRAGELQTLLTGSG